MATAPVSVTTEDVSFPGSSVPTLTGVLARPDGSRGEGPFPAVVIIHEAFGLNDNIRDITRRFAEQGYIALAVDLFAGRNQMVCMARFMGGMFTNSLNHGGIQDLKTTLNYLVGLSGVDAARLGAVGYCMGGSFAIAWASVDNRLKAIAPYYAFNPRPIEAVERLCPVVGSYPEKDMTAGMGRKLDEKLTALKIEHDIKIYPEAKHSFFNDRGGNHDPDAAKDSWERVLAFFQTHIR